jgi:NTE family protein
MPWFRIFVGLCAGFALVACASVSNHPINLPLTDGHTPIAGDGRPSDASEDDMLVSLAFSGGGTRAAAFSFGVLKGFSRTTVIDRGRPAQLIDRVDFVTAVSGGSVTAAYFGLKGSAALADFRERFLLRNAEEALNTAINLINFSRALAGGANQDVPLRNWLDANLFEGATFRALRTERRPRVWINATDIYNRTPFVFGKTAFGALCSDLADYPVAGAVAASAAVPLAFAPVVLQNYPERCRASLPEWITRAAGNVNAPPLLHAFARGVRSYRDPAMKYVKLLDGGLVDNFGLSGFTISLESAEAPYQPMSRAEAVRLRRILFLVVDAGRGPQGDWAGRLQGPSGVELVDAVTSAAIDASVRASYTAFKVTMNAWRDGLVRWRCALPAAEVARLRGERGHWNCHDVKVFVGRLAFDQLDSARAARLNAVPTRFVLPAATVDDLVAAGEDALAASPTFAAFRRSMAAAPPRQEGKGKPVVSANR